MAANANPPGWFWGTNLADFDNDGWQDIYAANGWVYNDKDTDIELTLSKVVSDQRLYKTATSSIPTISVHTMARLGAQPLFAQRPGWDIQRDRSRHEYRPLAQ
jgi:hypothetical protein